MGFFITLIQGCSSVSLPSEELPESKLWGTIFSYRLTRVPESRRTQKPRWRFLVTALEKKNPQIT